MAKSKSIDNFEFEFKMSMPIWEYYSQKSSDNSAYFPIPEFVTPWGIADLVLLNFKLKEINIRFEENLTAPIIRRLGALVMSNLKYNRHTSIDKLSIACAKKPSYLKSSVLNFLLDKNYIFEPQKNYYIKNSKYTDITSDITAIEFKKNDYKKAIYQAQRYKLFADKIFVALPEEKINTAFANLDLFRDKEIGLMSVNRNSAKKVFSAKKNKPLSRATRILCEEKGFQSLLESRNKKSTFATYKVKPSIQMSPTRFSFELNKSLIF